MEALHIEHLTFTYPGGERPALKDVTLSVERGGFLALCGPSGGGKTTLLRLLKPEAAPRGRRGGQVLFQGRPMDALDRRTACGAIGFVGQHPEHQCATDKVWHELAFGLESLGCETQEIRGRVAEMASFFGIQNWFRRDIAELSGGQRQLLALASVLVLRPEVLLLDEPTAQLDPIAAGQFLEAVGRVNRELGTAVVLSEHRLEEVFPLADRTAVLAEGRLLACTPPAEAGAALRACGLAAAVPAPMRVWAASGSSSPCPVTVSQGRRWLEHVAGERPLDETAVPEDPAWTPGEPVIQVQDAWFRYEREQPDIIRDLSLIAYPGELLAVLGGNGAGKSTALTLLAGLRKPWRGSVKVLGQKPQDLAAGTVGLLPQDPQVLFLRSSLREDLAEMLEDRALAPEEQQRRLSDAVSLCGLTELLDRHPYDLSGGEQQRAALAKLLLLDPQVLLLDEPTRGLDACFKEQLAEILRRLCGRGVAVVLVSHDVEFCARYAQRCALFFDGGLVSVSTPRRFFGSNAFYTTAARRMADTVLPRAVLAEDLIAALHGSETQPPPFSPPADGETPQAPLEPPLEAEGRGGLPRRTIAGIAVSLLAVPATILAGIFLLDDRKYWFISFLVLLETMLPFFLAFEGRKPLARELLLLAVLCALGVAGRAAFYMLPQFKPVVAVVTVAGAAFGAESGFLVGAVTAFISNLFFGQGPWTPWQMFAFGMAGFLAGLIFRRRSPGRGALCVYGALVTFFFCGALLDTGSALMWQAYPSLGAFLSYYLTGLPFNLIHAAATVFFLWLFGKPLLEKLDRVKNKYGLLNTSCRQVTATRPRLL